MRLAVLLVSIGCACAPGPTDVVETGGHNTHGPNDAGAPQHGGAYAYAAKRPLVAIGLADATGVSDDDSHRVVDALADAAEACFKRSANLASGAARITVPIDAGGIAGSPLVTITPQEATAIGMLCLLAPIRMAAFSPAPGDGGARSITIESAWRAN